MADSNAGTPTEERRPILHVSQSFSRLDRTRVDTIPRKRASTLQDSGIPAVPGAKQMPSPDGGYDALGGLDVFENNNEEGVTPDLESSNPNLRVPSTLEELPIEIQSSTERFLDSLSAKIHPSPMTAEGLSDLFQDFYERVAKQINTHIASLSSRIGRGKPQSSATGTRSTRTRSRAGSGTSMTSTAGGEMLTASEVFERRKARRQLEVQRAALEDAVERIACERVYDRIWQHRSTEDEARDEKLRSRTAALSLVGIGLKELHMDTDPAKESVRTIAAEKSDEIYESLAPARLALQHMDAEKHPLGKLHHLTAAHKSIVETLSHLFPSSSSADEVLPTLIYTLITSPPEGINAVSNLYFIQRFRNARKMDGEAAYCLVNLEAAIVFLETVDLSSLRADEAQHSRPKSNASEEKAEEKAPREIIISPASDTPSTLAPKINKAIATASDKSEPQQTSANSLKATSGRPTMQQRRLSELVQAQADRIGAGRENFLSAADRVYESINGSLENSLQFVFGRFKEQTVGRTLLPKTLEDARRLISPGPADIDELLGVSGGNSPVTEDPLATPPLRGDTKMLDLIGGRKTVRERSTDSARSGGSSRPSTTTSGSISKEKAKDESAITAANLFSQINQINPLNRFVPGFGRFGRNVPAVTSPSITGPDRSGKLSGITEDPSTKSASESGLKSSTDIDDGEELNARETLAELKQLRPPKKRFLEVESVNDLKLGEIEELLADYRRLAKAIGQAISR